MEENQINNPLQSKQAKISLTLGIVGLIAWIIPIIWLPIQVTGLVYWIKSISSNKKAMASAGVTLCIVWLVLTTANASIGAYMWATWQHQLVNKIYNDYMK